MAFDTEQRPAVIGHVCFSVRASVVIYGFARHDIGERKADEFHRVSKHGLLLRCFGFNYESFEDNGQPSAGWVFL